MSNQSVTLRLRISQILSANSKNDSASRWFDYALVCLISLNVLAVIFGSVDTFYENNKRALFLFELLSVIAFTIEYIARIWSSVEVPEDTPSSALKVRLRYLCSPMAIIDLLSILPFYLSYFTVIDLRILRIIRLLRVFKLARYSSAMDTLLSVISKEAGALIASFFIMFLTMLLAASGIYLLEQNIQPDEFGSIPQAMWWAVATLTTVGYGDVVPMSVLGKLFGGVIIFLGVAMVALPTGIIASGFANTFRSKRIHYETEIEEALEDGVLSVSEKRHLYKTRKDLGISAEEAEHIYRMAMDRLKLESAPCPHCGKPK